MAPEKEQCLFLNAYRALYGGPALTWCILDTQLSYRLLGAATSPGLICSPKQCGVLVLDFFTCKTVVFVFHSITVSSFGVFASRLPVFVNFGFRPIAMRPTR